MYRNRRIFAFEVPVWEELIACFSLIRDGNQRKRCAQHESSLPRKRVYRGVSRFPESWESKIWSWVRRDYEPRMTVLARTRRNLHDRSMCLPSRYLITLKGLAGDSGDTQTDTQKGDLISFLLYFQNKKIRLKKFLNCCKSETLLCVISRPCSSLCLSVCLDHQRISLNLSLYSLYRKLLSKFSFRSDAV
jgi:hypothetical protein